MIDACSFIRRFAVGTQGYGSATQLLCWVEEWQSSAGKDIIAGLLDTALAPDIRDLDGADLVVRNFVDEETSSRIPTEHATHAVTTLIAQGHAQIRGIAPRARLLLARVVNCDGIAMPGSVARAIDWLLTSGAQVVAFPLGTTREHSAITEQIIRASEAGVLFFAAAGNAYPDPVLFPARHPLCVAVGAADFKGHLLPECSYVPRLDIVAPGYQITALIRGRMLRKRRGSSVACVIAAGVAMLALSAGAITGGPMQRATMLQSLIHTGCRETSKGGMAPHKTSFT